MNEVDLYAQLRESGLELVSCSLAKKSRFLNISFARIKIRDLVQMFVHLNQLQGAGVPLLESLEDLRNSADNEKLRDVIADMYKKVSDGKTLSNSMKDHPKVFSNIYISLVAAGEETGNLSASFQEIIKYAKWTDELQRSVKKATRYPIIVSIFVFLALIIMMSWVVPQVVGFLESMDQELPGITLALIATSDFIVDHFWMIILAPFVITALVKLLIKRSDSFAYAFDAMILNLPVFGSLVRKINIARFAQTFGVLFTAGIDILRCLSAGKDTVTNLAIRQSLDHVDTHIRDGKPVSQSLDMSGEFPSLVIRMVKIGEESGRMREVLDQVSEFYNNDVNEAIQAMIAMIEPLLTLVMGGMIVWIAAAIFGPIYSNLANMPM